jgi:hypothetical protein
MIPRTWTCTADDVWQLSSFLYSVGDDLKIKLGKSSVVFGRHETNVVWAVVLPDEPGKLRSTVNADGEPVQSIWLRFNPALVAELFPTDTVTGHGPADAVLWAKRIAAWKMQGCWQAGNLPVIPTRESIMIDAETADGPRRFFSVDTKAETVKYEPFFANRSLPKLVPVEPEQAVEVFDKVWSAFDREYAMFGIKPKLDWDKQRETFRPRAREAKTTYKLAAVIAEMLASLEDLHVGISVQGEPVPCFNRDRPLNANWRAAAKLLSSLEEVPRTLAWGRTDDGIGYINLYTLGNPNLTGAFDGVLDKLGDTWGLIIDLRFNGGGDELLGRDVAGRFIDEERVYSYNHYRDPEGKSRTDLGPRLSRACAVRGPWRYASPVVVLIGQRTMSSAESLACMFSVCPQVVTIGDKTAGASANPRRLDAGCDIMVIVPRWLDLGPDGKPFESVGLQPKIAVAASPDDFTDDKDPVLQKALDHLRAIPDLQRQPGKRE